MTRIRITIDGAVVQERDVEGPLVLGRSARADLVVDDRQVSSRHGRIEPEDDTLVFTDLGSTNGTFLGDGTRVAPGDPVRLDPGVKLIVGPALIEAVHLRAPDEGVDMASMMRDETMVVDEGGAGDLLVEIARFKAADARLVVAVEHERRVVRIDSMETTIGRRPPAQVVIQHASVSSEHAMLRFEGGQFIIEDLGSANGTQVTGRRITGPTVLAYQCALTIGTVECLFVHGEPQADAGEDDPYARALADHVVSLRKATRLQADEAVAALRADGTSLGETFVAKGLLTPAEWTELFLQRDVIRTLDVAGAGGRGNRWLPWLVAVLVVVAAALFLMVRGW